MNIEQLEKVLDNLGIPKNYYSINGHLVTDIYVLNQVHSKWEYFYYDEKGNQEGYKIFYNENEACKYLLEKLRNELNYPSSTIK